MNDHIYLKLKEWRNSKSYKLEIDAFKILHDTMIELIATRQPTNLQELRSIRGIGRDKTNKFGYEIIAIVKKYSKKKSGSAARNSSKEGLFTKLSRVVSNLDPLYSTSYSEINVSNIITTKEKVSKAFSHNRSGSQSKEITINEKKYVLYLKHKNNGRSQLVSGTVKKVKEFCEKMLELIDTKRPRNIDKLLSLMSIRDIAYEYEYDDEKETSVEKPSKMRAKPNEATNKDEKLIPKIKRKINEIDCSYSISWNEIPNSNEAGKQKMVSKNNYYDENGYKTIIEKRYELYLVHRNEKKSLLVAGTVKKCKEFCVKMLELLEKVESGNSEELRRLFNG